VVENGQQGAQRGKLRGCSSEDGLRGSCGQRSEGAAQDTDGGMWLGADSRSRSSAGPRACLPHHQNVQTLCSATLPPWGSAVVFFSFFLNALP
jgi:hypothetical protein